MTGSPDAPIKGQHPTPKDAPLPGVDAVAHPGGSVAPQLVQGQEHHGLRPDDEPIPYIFAVLRPDAKVRINVPDSI